MASQQTRVNISRGAAQLAASWKAAFAKELRVSAKNLAGANEVVTESHYELALPIALSKVGLLIEPSHSEEAPNDERRAA